MSKGRLSQHPDHQDHNNQTLPLDATVLDKICAATQSVPHDQRQAAISSAVDAIEIGRALRRAHLNIYRALLARLDWRTGATCATSVDDLCIATRYAVRTVTRGLEILLGRRLVLQELVPTELSRNARYYAFPALADVSSASARALTMPPRAALSKPARTPAQLNESQVQRAVVQHLLWRAVARVFWLAVPNGGWRTKAEAAIFSGQGVIAGVPDLIVIARGLPFGLELKAERGVLSKVQSEVHARMREAGAIVATAYGLDEALRQLEAWGVLRPDADRRAEN